MKNRSHFWWVVPLAGLIILGMVTQKVSANNREQFQASGRSSNGQQAAQTLIPTVSPSYPVDETQEPRVLPQVGGNAGLVLGASVLVIIIIGGVILSARRKAKH